MGLLIWLMPLSLLMGGVGLSAFFWALRNGQFDDTEGDAQRVLIPDFDEHPKAEPKEKATI